jgi:hypothetical protein
LAAASGLSDVRVFRIESSWAGGVAMSSSSVSQGRKIKSGVRSEQKFRSPRATPKKSTGRPSLAQLRPEHLEQRQLIAARAPASQAFA